MLNKVIATTHYRRPDQTRNLFEALSRCYGIKDYTVLISVDFNNLHAAKCQEVVSICEEFARSGIAKGGGIAVNNPRLGIDVNKLHILQEAFHLSDYVIFLEDDTPISPDGLRWFEWAGEHFKDDQSVGSITGYNRVVDFAADQVDPYSYDQGGGFTPWGWSTWKDRYEAIWGKDGSKYREAFPDEVNGRFDHHANGQIGSSGRRTIYPVLARTQHAGWEDAEHTPSREFWEEREWNPVWAGCLDLPDPPAGAWHPPATSLELTRWSNPGGKTSLIENG